MLDQVFHKTVAGQTELTDKTHGLSPTQRRLLIMLDGKKALSDCAPYFRESDDLMAMIKVLLTLKLIDGGKKDPWETTTILPVAMQRHKWLPRVQQRFHPPPCCRLMK